MRVSSPTGYSVWLRFDSSFKSASASRRACLSPAASAMRLASIACFPASTRRWLYAASRFRASRASWDSIVSFGDTTPLFPLVPAQWPGVRSVTAEGGAMSVGPAYPESAQANPPQRDLCVVLLPGVSSDGPMGTHGYRWLLVGPPPRSSGRPRQLEAGGARRGCAAGQLVQIGGKNDPGYARRISFFRRGPPNIASSSAQIAVAIVRS